MEIYIVDDHDYGLSRLGSIRRNYTVYPANQIEIWCLGKKLHMDNIKAESMLVFVHISNEEASYINNWKEVPNYPEGISRLAYVSWRICYHGGKVVIFSGGAAGEFYKDIKRFLEKKGLEEGKDFIFLELSDIAENKIPGEIKKNWRVDSLYKKRDSKNKITQPFIALDNLLQRYLKEKPNKDCLFGPVGDNGNSWFDDCMSDVEEYSFTELKEKNQLVAQCENLEFLWFILRKECLQKDDELALNNYPLDWENYKDWNQSKFTRLFYLAHLEITKIPEMIEKAEELNDIRSNINHNYITNDFLNKIGNAQPYIPIKEKNEKILKVWDAENNPNAVFQDIEANKHSLNKGLKKWPEIVKLLEKFLENSIKEYNFIPTPKLEKVIRELFEGDNSLTNRITHFVDKFYEIGKELEYKENKEKYKKLEKDFWEPSKKIKEIFSDMRLSGNFNKYFRFIFEE